VPGAPGKHLWRVLVLVAGLGVYLVLFSILGDSTGAWSAAKDAPRDRVHSPHTFSLVALTGDLFRVNLSSE